MPKDVDTRSHTRLSANSQMRDRLAVSGTRLPSQTVWHTPYLLFNPFAVILGKFSLKKKNAVLGPPGGSAS